MFLLIKIYTYCVNKEVGDTIRELRKEKHLSQEKLAEKCKLHRTYISSIECYKRSISLENIQRRADALEFVTYKLFMESDKNEEQ